MNTYLIAALFFLEAVFAALFIKAGWPESTKKGFFFKMCACAVFLLNGFYAFRSTEIRYFSLAIIAGLAAGFLGDIFLTLDPFIKDKKSKVNMVVIITGGICFLFGHIAYILAFVRTLISKGLFRPVLICSCWAAAFILFVVIKAALRVKFGKLTAPVFAYAAIIIFMLSCAVCLAVYGIEGKPLAKTALIAAPVLFIVSDFSLVLKFFDKERFNTLPVRAINLVTYFLSQMLLGLSIWYVM
jgi:uncharacterized membrane protein YhhN